MGTLGGSQDTFLSIWYFTILILASDFEKQSTLSVMLPEVSHVRAVLFPAISRGGIPPPPEPQIPPGNTQNTENIKKCIEFTPQICVSPSQNLESRINTDVWVALYQLSVMLSRVSQVSGYPVICVRSNRQGNVDIKNIDYCIPLVVGN